MVSPNPDSNGGNSTASKASSAAPSTLPDAVIRLAGNSQDGIQTIGGFLARLAGRSDQDVITYMTIPSTISGGPSIFQVRMGTGEILSVGDQIDFLVAFYQHSYEAHIGSLRDGGILIYDSDHVKPDPTDRRCIYVPVPITTTTIEVMGGSSKDKGKNMFVLGLLSRVFNLDVAKLQTLVRERFAGKSEDIARNALHALDAGYAYPVDHLLGQLYRFESNKRTSGKPQITMDGNTALAYGLIAAGVRYGAAYPITPWTSIMEVLRSELPKYGGTFVQAEDELAAVSTALGFAYSGHLAVTGSSGPGLSLKMEALGWGVMAEMPLIVINVQRGGPSTGLPTNIEQSDLLQAIYGSHGDAPRVVLAPQDVEDCFYVALEAATIARERSVPVIILTDQALATRIEAFDEPDLPVLMQNPAPDLSPRPADFKPYPLEEITRHAPPGSVIGSGVYPTVTGLEHDELGHPTANPALHMKMTARRRDKVRSLGEALPRPKVHGDQEGDILLISWGSPYGPTKEAINRLRAKGEKCGHLQLRHLHPLPPELERIFARFRQIFVVEINDQGLYGFGQLATLLRARYANPAIRSITKTDGLAFKTREITAGVDRLRGAASASVSAYPLDLHN
ncbi:MAG: 2-oxoacid:acceptor oxidoreductase subunit alpha [Cephaloticoccus sp.]|nr:2-oxoacid:acceptor oxidoreductase subunit alpha [Cephaloticoccus sp.]MCF7761532.1 2-oxoacid:acceptor oxidoreductase subunit alpha [Cephaloticoccus sp.]